MLKFCPECGSKLNGGKFCVNCGADLSKYGAASAAPTAAPEAFGTGSALDDALGNLMGLASERQTEDKLRVMIIRGRYDEAKALCNTLIDNDPMDTVGYIGLIRIASKNYKIEPNAEVNEQIRIATEVFGEEAILADMELSEYLAKYPKSPERQAALAEKYLKEGNYSEALKWLHKSAEGGYAHSYFVLAQLYENGTGVIKNLNLALQNYSKAADAGDKSAIAYYNPTEAEAQYKLALNFYFTGNYDGAKWWFEIAGNNNYNIAVYYLGLMHEDGKGFPQDRDRAYELYSSVKMGCQEAWDAVQRIDEQRIEEQRLKAEKMEAERKRQEAEKAEAERKRREAERAEAERKHREAVEAERRRIEAERVELERKFSIELKTNYDGSYKLIGVKDKSIRSINISNRVTEIGDSAFHGCRELTSVTIPNSVKCIRQAAFWECFSLRDITIPNSLEELELSVFSCCISLTCITLPNSLKNIEAYAFRLCSLQSITIPSSVQNIEEFAFTECAKLKSASVPYGCKFVEFGSNRSFPVTCKVTRR